MPQERSEAIDLKELIKKSFSLFGGSDRKLVVFLQGSILKLQKYIHIYVISHSTISKTNNENRWFILTIEAFTFLRWHLDFFYLLHLKQKTKAECWSKGIYCKVVGKNK